MAKLVFSNYDEVLEGRRWTNKVFKTKDNELITEDNSQIITSGINWEIEGIGHETIRPAVVVGDDDIPKWSQGVLFEGPKRIIDKKENFKPGVIIVPYRWRLSEFDNQVEIGFIKRMDRVIPLNIEQTAHGKVELIELPRGYAEKDDQSWIDAARREFKTEFADIDNIYPKVLGIINCNTAIIATYIYIVAIQLDDKSADAVRLDIDKDEEIGKHFWLTMEQIQEYFTKEANTSIKCGLTLTALSLFMLKCFKVEGQPRIFWNGNQIKSEFSVLLKLIINQKFNGSNYDLAWRMVEMQKVETKDAREKWLKVHLQNIKRWLDGSNPKRTETFDILKLALEMDDLEKYI
jgi:hypothetical protein